MWKWLHPYAHPQRAYELSQRWAKGLLWVGGIGLLVGSLWGLLWSPQDYQQGHSVRIMYIHVPTAIWSMGLYASMAISALVALVWQQPLAALSIRALAVIGAWLTFLALITGAVWGKPTWGTWWVWDARLTSELILLFLYLSILALYQAFEQSSVGAKAAAILALVGVINLPIIHFSVEWWNTLHQGASITKFEKPSIAPSMLWPLLINMLALGLWSYGMALRAFGQSLLLRDLHRPWVSVYLQPRQSNS